MNISFYFKNIEATDALKKYSESKISKLYSRFHHVESIDVRLFVERQQQFCEITIHADASVFHIKKSEKDLYMAIDAAVDRLDLQLDKHHKKMSSKNRSDADLAIAMPSYSQPEETSEEEALPVAVYDAPAKPMTELEAILQLKINKHRFLMYHSMNQTRYSLVFYRPDGNFSVIVPAEEMGQYREGVYRFKNNTIEEISKSVYPVARLSVSEAIESLKENHQDYYSFVNEDSLRLNVLFYTKNGELALKRPPAEVKLQG